MEDISSGDTNTSNPGTDVEALVWEYLPYLDKLSRKHDTEISIETAFKFVASAVESYDETKRLDKRTTIKNYLRRAVVIQKRLDIRDSHRSKREAMFDPELCSESDSIKKYLDSIRQNNEDCIISDGDIESVRTQISAEDYDILIRYFVNHESMEQIGNDLGILRGTVWARIKKLLSKIRGDSN